MASNDPVDIDEVADQPTQDVEMDEQDGDDVAAADNADDETKVDDTEAIERVTFLDYLKSPIVDLVCGSDGEQETLHAHQRLLLESPFLADKISEFTQDQTSRTIALPEEDLSTVSAFLEYLYRKDYFPALSQPHVLETDPSMPEKDDQGTALLRHAKIYTLAQKFGVPALASLAHKKIHLTASSAKGEISYARYIYGHTDESDTTIRKPVANFWATRSHVLRHSAESEFRSMCLEFPQFGFDVLQMVLDMQEKKMGGGGGAPGSSQAGRKRARVSQA